MTKSYLSPPRKENLQCTPVQKYTPVSSHSGFCHLLEVSHRSDQTRQTPESWFILILILFFRQTSFIFIIFIPTLIILFLLVQRFTKMAVPLLQGISR